MSLCCTVGYKWVTVMDGVKFEFNDIGNIIAVWEKRFWAKTVSQPMILVSIFDDIIKVNKVIYI